MWERLRSIWTVPDLRNKILFTLGILLLTRLLANIAIPLTAAEQKALFSLFNSNSNQNLGQLLGLLDVFSGGSLQHFSIIALGVYPYITATIVMQLLQPIIPALQNLSMQGEAGRLRFSQITRIIAVPLAFLQALGNCALYQSQHVLQNFSLIDPQYALETWTILVVLTAGTMVLV
jgi:preprotein translocase subunit SecY